MGLTGQHIGLNYSGTTLVAFRVVLVNNTTNASERFACFSMSIIVVWRWQADILDRRTENRRRLILRSQLWYWGGGPRRHTCARNNNIVGRKRSAATR